MAGNTYLVEDKARPIKTSATVKGNLSFLVKTRVAAAIISSAMTPLTVLGI
jgi:hypothetical protein